MFPLSNPLGGGGKSAVLRDVITRVAVTLTLYLIYFRYSTTLRFMSSKNETNPMALVKLVPSTSCSSMR